MKKKEQLNIKNRIYQHISNNSKEYILITLIFIIGIFLGVMFINNIQEAKMSEITSYLNSFINKLKKADNLNSIQLLETTIFENVILGVTLWFLGTTVIRYTICFWYYII